MTKPAQSGPVRRVVSTRLPTKWGNFQLLGFERDLSNGTPRIDTALAMVLGDVTAGAPLLRIHAQCFTSEMLGSLRCDCKDQLDLAMQAIADEGRGIIIYEHQEGRGIGLMAKLRAYALQDEGFDTVQANHELGFAADSRDFSLPAAILHELDVSRVRLLSNNPQKFKALSEAGIEVVSRISCEVPPTPHSHFYLWTKKRKMGHLLTLDDDFEFATIDQAIAELRSGRMIVVVDDEDRENEGDLVMAAELITPEAINFLIDAGYNPDFGARPLKRAIERLIEDPMSEKLLRGEFNDSKVVNITLKDKALCFDPEIKETKNG